jgi:integration host factor subunit alpha
MTNLTKADLVDILVQELNFDKKDAKVLVDGFFNGIKRHLCEGHSVRLSGFGNFVLRDKSSRPGRNPKTGEEVMVTARRVVTFRAGTKLKSFVQGTDN